MKFIFYLILFFFTVSGFAQESSTDIFTDVKINLTTASTPLYNVKSNNKVTSLIKNWILINLEYTPGLEQKKEVPSNRYMDGLTIKFELVSRGFSINNSYYLSTQINYLSVKIDGKKNYALVLLPPNIVDRIKYPVKKIEKILDRIVVKVTFILDGKEVQKEYSHSSKSYITLFNNIINFEKTVKLSVGLLNRLETPWNNLNYNRYEIIKQ